MLKSIETHCGVVVVLLSSTSTSGVVVGIFTMVVLVLVLLGPSWCSLRALGGAAGVRGFLVQSRSHKGSILPFLGAVIAVSL